MEKILIIDDERSLLEVLGIFFKKRGYEVLLAETAGDGLRKIEGVDVIISDIKLPDFDGITLLEKVKKLNPDIPVILITAYASAKDAVRALKLGAEDYIIKPFDMEELLIVVEKTLKRRKLEQEVEVLKRRIKEQDVFSNFVGNSRRMQEVIKLVKRVAPKDVTVLIEGESGTGKELLAKIIHSLSSRANKPFVSINCGAIPETLLESELFGYVKGAFTGAYSDKKGLFEIANGGTVFLDEISEMSPMMQVKLLRFLQERKFRRVGGERELEVDVRIIAATNRNLEKLVKEGKFRDDLFYRLDVVRITLPPLRERREDIPLLVDFFIKRYSSKFNKPIRGITKEALSALENYPWPGNVRELENVIERAVVLEEGELITPESLPEKIFSSVPVPHQELTTDFNLQEYLENVIRHYVKLAYEKAGGNKKKAAELLGLSYRSYRHYWEKYVKEN